MFRLKSFEVWLHACELLLNFNGVAELGAYVQDANESGTQVHNRL